MIRAKVALSLIVALVACGRVKGPDGGGGDGGAGGDGGDEQDAAVPGLVEVTVLSDEGRGNPKEDVPVLFFQPDGTEAAAEMTDADGHASAELLPGGAVIAFTYGDSLFGVASPVTWAAFGVQPGDHITFGRPRSFADEGTPMTISLPIAKSINFHVSTPCGTFYSETWDVPIYVYDWCDQEPFGLVGTMISGESRYHIVAEDVEIDEEEPFVVPGEYELATAPDVTVEGLDEVAYLYARWSAARVSGQGIPLDIIAAEGEVDGDTLTLSPPKLGEPPEVVLDLLLRDQQPSLGTQTYFLWREGNGDDEPVVLDLADFAMPRVGTPTFEKATGRLRWTQIGDGDHDATYIHVRWTLGDDKKTFQNGVWRIVAPPGVNEVVLPPVPEEYEDWLPDYEFLYPDLKLMDADGVDWDAARQLGFEPWNEGYGVRSGHDTVRYARSPVTDG